MGRQTRWKAAIQVAAMTKRKHGTPEEEEQAQDLRSQPQDSAMTLRAPNEELLPKGRDGPQEHGDQAEVAQRPPEAVHILELGAALDAARFNWVSWISVCQTDGETRSP